MNEVMQSMKTRPATPGRAARSAGHSISRKPAARHAELARQPPLVGGNGLQRLQEQPGRQRQVEEHMGDENARQAVNARPALAGNRVEQPAK